MKNKNSLLSASVCAALSLSVCNLNAAQVFTQDVVVQGSICVGFDCVNGESFGSDTLRLKENNLRIHFQDTSNSASFPTNDWRITINDSTNGGANYFAISDTTSGRDPFKIEAGAGANSLYVDDGGRVGLGTANPVVELHVVDGDSPTLRLEQDGSSGFSAQTWDVAGNETNFFVRDATNGSTLPFRIEPRAPSNSLFVSSEGGVGIGTNSTLNALRVVDSDLPPGSGSCGPLDCSRYSGVVTIEDTNASSAGRALLTLKNNGPSWLVFENNQDRWNFTNSSGQFSLAYYDSALDTLSSLLTIDSAGNLSVPGTINGGSSLSSKSEITEVDYTNILERLMSLPISSWQYKKDATGSRHIGPISQDFFSKFEVGTDEEHISPLDVSGVALASIKALVLELRKSQKELLELKEKVAKLESD